VYNNIVCDVGLKMIGAHPLSKYKIRAPEKSLIWLLKKNVGNFISLEFDCKNTNKDYIFSF